MAEIWKDVPGFEGHYQISDSGKIRSLDRYVRIGGDRMRFIAGMEIKPTLCRNGYLEAMLSKSGERQVFLLHRLVAMLFIPNPNNYPQINHKDENLSNNHVNNLEWCTAKYNANYGTRNERASRKQMKPVNQYDKNGHFLKTWDGMGVAGRELNISSEVIGRCCSGKQETAGGYVWRYAKLNG